MGPHRVGALPGPHGPDHVLGVGDPDHVVDLLLDGRHPAEADLQGPLQGRLHRLVGTDGHHVGPGHHDLADHGVAELDDRMDEGALLGLDHVPLQGHVGHGQQLRLGHRRAEVLALLADEQVGQADQGPRHHPHRPEPDDGRDQRGAEQGGPLGVVDGPVLRHRLAEDEDDHDLEDGGRDHAPGAEPAVRPGCPTRVATTSWQMSTSSRTGLRKPWGFSVRRTSTLAPRRPSSTRAMALARLMRTRLVSARASMAEAASSTTTTTMRIHVARR